MSNSGSASPAIGRDPLVGNPQPFGGRARLPEYVDRDAAAREPVSPDPQPTRRGDLDDPASDGHRAVLMERAMVAEGAQIELQRLGFDQPVAWRIVDHQMREVRLARHWAERCELRRGEPGDRKS